jgi:hypothetical protein
LSAKAEHVVASGSVLGADAFVDPDAPLGARPPGEALEHVLPRAAAETRPKRIVRQQLRDALAKLSRVARLDEEPGLTVLDDLRNAADAARDHGRSTRHRLERRQPEELGDGDEPAEARPMDGRQHDRGGVGVEHSQRLIGHRAEKHDVPSASETPQQLRIVALRRPRIVAVRARNDEARAGGQAADQHVDALVRRQSAHEQHVASRRPWLRMEPTRVHTPVDDTRLRWGRPEHRGGVLGHEEKRIEQPGKKARPRSARETVVGDDDRLPPHGSGDRRDARRRAAHVVDMDDVCRRERGGK